MAGRVPAADTSPRSAKAAAFVTQIMPMQVVVLPAQSAGNAVIEPDRSRNVTAM